MMEFRFDNTGKTMSASVFEQSIPPIYQYFNYHGMGTGVYGNDNHYTVSNLQSQLDEFASIWLNNLSLQGYIPVRGIKEIDGVDVQVLFDDEGQVILPETEKPEVKIEDVLLTTSDIASAESDIANTDKPTHDSATKEYSLGYGFLGNGITVWNRADIPLSKERQQRILIEQIQEIEDAMRELQGDEDERFTVKQMERTKKSLESHLSKLLDGKKKDGVVTFEQLGVDRLFIDESHLHKNLYSKGYFKK